jgi:hypothetical protein
MPGYSEGRIWSGSFGFHHQCWVCSAVSGKTGARATGPVARVGKRHDVIGALAVRGFERQLVTGPAGENMGSAHITNLIGFLSRREVGIADPALAWHRRPPAGSRQRRCPCSSASASISRPSASSMFVVGLPCPDQRPGEVHLQIGRAGAPAPLTCDAARTTPSALATLEQDLALQFVEVRIGSGPLSISSLASASAQALISTARYAAMARAYLAGIDWSLSG